MKLGIAKRLGLWFGLTILTSAALSIFAFDRLQQISKGSQLTTKTMLEVQLSQRGEYLAQQINGQSLEHILDEEDDEKTILDKEITGEIERGNLVLEKLTPLATEEEQRNLLD